MRLFLEEGGRPRAPWRLLAQLAFFVTATTIFTSLLAIPWFFVSGGASLGDSARATVSSPAFFFISGLASLLGAFTSMWLAGRVLDRRPFADFGFHLNSGWWLDLGFGMFLGALLMTAIFSIELAFGWITVTGSFEAVSSGTPFLPAILLPIGVFLCVGVYEEMVSRGYQLRNVAEGLNYPSIGPRTAVLTAWVLTSGAFGLLHLANPNATLVSTVNIALAGLLLGAGYVLTGELAIPIGLHISWNFFQGNVYGFPVSGLDPIGATFLTIDQSGPDLWTGGVFGPEAGLLDPLAVLIGSLLIVLWVRLRHGEVRFHTLLAAGPADKASASNTPD